MYPRSCRTAAAVGVAALALAAATSASATNLPDGRSYEMVSPAQKYYGIGAAGSFNGRALADGGSFFYNSLQALPGSPDGEGSEDYRGDRGASGWATMPLVPATELNPAQNFKDGFGDRLAVSSDGQSVLYVTARALDPGDQDYDAADYASAMDLYLRKPDGTFTWVTPGAANGNPFWVNNILWGLMSSDASHVVFLSGPALLPEDSARTNGMGLYDWHDGALHLVAVDDSGSLLSNNGVLLGTGANTTADGVGPNAMSENGKRIFFTVDNRLYVREDEQSTRPLAPGGDPSHAQAFAAATPDGSKVYFTTIDPLTSDDHNAGRDLYEVDTSSGNLRLLSAGSSDTNSVGAVRASADGSRVFFVDGDPLTSDAPAGGGLYVSDDRGLSFIASAPGLTDGPGCSTGGDSNWRVTPDGEHVVFATGDAVTADDHDSSVDLFEWSAATGAVVRVSGDGDRGNGAFDAQMSSADSCTTASGDYQPARVVSDDGRFVFFQTTEGLVPEDTNGVTDVYEHDLATDKTSLLSSGTGARPSLYLDSSTSGADVFFGTYDPLVAQDGDDRLDVYDARIGGGFPVGEPAPGCVDDQCQGAAHGGVPAPVTGGSQTIHSESAPPAVVPKKPALTLRHISAGQLRHAARTGRLKLRLRANVAGRIFIHLRTRSKHHVITVGALATKVGPSEWRTATVTLTHTGRQRLRHHHSLSLRVRAILMPGHVLQQVHVRLVRHVTRPHRARGASARSAHNR